MLTREQLLSVLCDDTLLLMIATSGCFFCQSSILNRVQFQAIPIELECHYKSWDHNPCDYVQNLTQIILRDSDDVDSGKRESETEHRQVAVGQSSQLFFSRLSTKTRHHLPVCFLLSYYIPSERSTALFPFCSIRKEMKSHLRPGSCEDAV